MVDMKEAAAALQKQAEKGKTKKFLQMAVKYGVIKSGWTAIDYMNDAVRNYGWESTAIVGQKGQAKSNLLLQRGFAIYKDWKKVFANTVTKQDHFMALLSDAIEKSERIPWIGCDDIATIFPSSIYFTDRKLHSELKSSWETLRTVMSNFDWTATRKNKVAAFISEDITGDIICYNRRGDLIAYYDYRRWLWIRNFKDPTEMIAKLIAVEDVPFPLLPESFECEPAFKTGEYIIGGEVVSGAEAFKNKIRLSGVPRNEFKNYWNNRLDLANASFERFKRVIEASKRKQEKEASGGLTEQERHDRASNAAKARWSKGQL